VLFFFSSRRRHTRLVSDWSSDVCSSDLQVVTRHAGRSILPTTPAWRVTTWLLSTASICAAGILTITYLRAADLDSSVRRVRLSRSEERRVGKECRCRG